MRHLAIRSGPLPLHLRRLGLAPLMVFLLSCGGGDDSLTPPEVVVGQTVSVAVTTTGDDIDGDGYTVRLGARSESIPPNGTAIFEDVSAGTHEVRLEGVAGNCTVNGGAVENVSVSSSSGAQTSFTVVCNLDFADGLSTVACTELSLAATSGAPMDRIGAGIVPAALDPPLAARVLTRDGASLGYAWFEIDEEGRVEMVTPLHPSGSLEGGDVLIRATDGTVACAPWEFTIEPLPARPGELGAVVDGLQEVLRAQAAVLQTTPAELMSTPLGDLQEILLPLAIVQWVLDHPQNEYSLRSIADGSAPGAFPLDQIEALLARVGFREALDERLGAAQRAPAPTSDSIDPQTCTPEAIGGDPQRLSDCMNALGDVLDMMQGLADRIGPSLSAAIFLMRTTGAQQPLRDVLASLGWVAIQLEVRSLGLLPVSLRVEVVATPERFMEDDPRTGMWSAKLFAESFGWGSELPALVGMMAGSATDGLRRVGVDDLNLEDEVIQLLVGPVADLLPAQEIPSQVFGPVSVDDAMWSEVAYRPAEGQSPAIEKVTHTGYRPVAVGQTTLEVTAPPEAGGLKFGGQPFYGYVDVTVDSITIRVEPSDTVMAPGTSATFRITVENAYFPDSISIGTQQGHLSPVQHLGDGRFTVQYQAPSNPNFDDPDLIDALYDGSAGARVNGPERKGTALVRFGGIQISPQPVCLDTSEQTTFSATVLGIDNQDVEWTADEGTIDNNGKYTAPPDRPASGYATIRATSAEVPALVGEIQVAIGCTCNFVFRLGGNTIVAQPGDRMVFTTSGGRLIGVNAVRASEGWSLFLRTVDANPANWPNAPGTWPMNVQGDMGLTDPSDILFTTVDGIPPLLDLEAFTSLVQVKGSVSGTVKVINTVSPTFLTFDWWFAIRYATGEYTCTVPGGGG